MTSPPIPLPVATPTLAAAPAPADPIAAPGRVGLRSIAAAVGMCALGFLLVAGVVHLGIRDPLQLHADIRSEKLFLLQQWRGKAYSASFGSSHMHNGFDPRAFDAAMAGTPGQTRSLNLAIAGGSQSEQRATALRFLAQLQPPLAGAASEAAGATSEARACLVILELGAGANFTNDHLVHPRAINLYDWATTRFVLRLASPAMGLRQRAGRAAYAVAAMALHYMSLGMLSNRIFPAPLDQQMLHDETVDDRRGLLVMRRQTPSFAILAARIAAAPSQPRTTAGILVPGNAELVDALAEASPVRQVQFAYLLLPKLGDLWQQTDYPASIATGQGQVPIVNLARPTAYPAIYDARLWYDDAHVNEQGAQLLTRMFAAELQRWYAVHGQPHGCGR